MKPVVWLAEDLHALLKALEAQGVVINKFAPRDGVAGFWLRENWKGNLGPIMFGAEVLLEGRTYTVRWNKSFEACMQKISEAGELEIKKHSPVFKMLKEKAH